MSDAGSRRADAGRKGGDADRERMRTRMREAGIAFVNLEFTDMAGVPKCVVIPRDEIEECLEWGRWIDGSCLEGMGRGAESDMYLRPDLATYAEIPWSPPLADGRFTDAGGLARLICDVVLPDGSPFDGEPRHVLKRAINAAADLGFAFEVACELEFFLLRAQGDGLAGLVRPPSSESGSYFDWSEDHASDVRREIVAALVGMGVGVGMSHHEVAPGQHEIDLAFADPLRAAAAVVTARCAVTAIAQRHMLRASFMPKPFYGVFGNGMHTHQRLRRLSDGGNALVDQADAHYGLSDVARQVIAGQLHHAAGMCAILAPTVNSYKRLVPGFEAPALINWGRLNREVFLRVPRAQSGRADQLSIELRCPDPTCNPYLAFAVMLSSALDGIRRRLEPGPASEEELFSLAASARQHPGLARLPSNLGEALMELGRDHLVVETLGDHISDWFIEVKTREWREYEQHVHQWELERYLLA